MRLIKMFGLAAIAAVAAMAFIGTGSASAVSICLLDVEECPAEHVLPYGNIIHGKAEDPILLTNLGNVLCEKSDTLGTIVKEGSTETSLMDEITELSFTNCKFVNSGNPCTVTVENLPYLTLLLLKPAPNEKEYHLVVEPKPGGGAPQAHVVCNKDFVDCTFGKKEVLFNVLLLKNLAGEPLDIDLSILEELERVKGLFCPKTSTWHAEYLVLCLFVKEVSEACYPSMKP